MEDIYDKLEIEANERELMDGNGNVLKDTKISKTTTESLKSGELLYNALEVFSNDVKDLEVYEQKVLEFKDFPKPLRNVFWTGQGCKVESNVYECLLFVLNKIRTSHLDDALLALPFPLTIELLKAIRVWTRTCSNVLVNRLLTIILKINIQEICNNRQLKQLLQDIKDGFKEGLQKERGVVGYNLAALKYLEQDRKDLVKFGQERVDEDKISVKRKIAVV